MMKMLPVTMAAEEVNRKTESVTLDTSSASPEAKVFDQDPVNKEELAAAQFQKKGWMRAKIMVAFSTFFLLTSLALMGLVYMADKIAEETETGSDGVMTVKGRSEVVRVDTVESFSSVWDLPAVSTDKLAYLKYLTVNINMTHMPAVGGMAEATFKIAGAYKAWGSKDKVFLTTAEGHTVTIDSRTRNGTIEMGTKGIFTISTNKIADNVMDRLRTKVLPKIPAKEEASAPLFFSKQALLEEAASTEEALTIGQGNTWAQYMGAMNSKWLAALR